VNVWVGGVLKHFGGTVNFFAASNTAPCDTPLRRGQKYVEQAKSKFTLRGEQVNLTRILQQFKIIFIKIRNIQVRTQKSDDKGPSKCKWRATDGAQTDATNPFLVLP